MAKQKRPRRMVFVEWDDSVGSSRWEDREEMNDREPLECETIGLLIEKTDEKVVIAGSYCYETDTVACVTVIPASTVKRVVPLGMIRDKKKAKR